MNLSTLNDAQRESVTTTEGNIRVAAGHTLSDVPATAFYKANAGYYDN